MVIIGQYRLFSRSSGVHNAVNDVAPDIFSSGRKNVHSLRIGIYLSTKFIFVNMDDERDKSVPPNTSMS